MTLTRSITPRAFNILVEDDLVGSAGDLPTAAALAAAHFARTGKETVINDGTADVAAISETAVPMLELRIDELNPSSLPAGGTTTNMHVIGNGFREGCVIVFAGQDERTDFETDTQCSTIVTASLFTNPDTVDVFVRNPDGAESNVLQFEFT